MVTKANKVVSLLAVFVLVLGIAGARATHITTSLFDLFNGGSILVGDKLFTDWGNETPNSLSDSELMNFTVTGLHDDPLNPGLLFEPNGALSVDGGETLDFFFNFTVTSLAGETLKDLSLELTEFDFSGNGSMRIDEAAFNEGVNFATLCVSANTGDPFCDGTFDSTEFSPLSSLFIEKEIQLDGGFTEGDSATIRAFTQHFSQVPEPTTLSLLGAGLAGLGFARRRKKI